MDIINTLQDKLYVYSHEGQQGNVASFDLFKRNLSSGAQVILYIHLFVSDTLRPFLDEFYAKTRDKTNSVIINDFTEFILYNSGKDKIHAEFELTILDKNLKTIVRTTDQGEMLPSEFISIIQHFSDVEDEFYYAIQNYNSGQKESLLKIKYFTFHRKCIFSYDDFPNIVISVVGAHRFRVLQDFVEYYTNVTNLIRYKIPQQFISRFLSFQNNKLLGDNLFFESFHYEIIQDNGLQSNKKYAIIWLKDSSYVFGYSTSYSPVDLDEAEAVKVHVANQSLVSSLGGNKNGDSGNYQAD